MKQGRIIVPAYNEEENVSLFYKEVIKYIDIKDYEFDILYVNDGSKDNTLEEIKKISKKDNRVKYISLSRNFGKESAMHAGLVNSENKDFVIIIDCDLQQPPQLITEMIKEYEEGYKIIYTKGKSRKGEPKLRTFFANWFYRIYNFYTEMPLENGAKDFQLLDKMVVKAFLEIKDNYRFVKGIFSWVGYSRKCIEYDFIPRQHGKSSWSFKSLMKYAFNGMNQFSTILLVLPVIFAFLSILLVIMDIILFTSNIFTVSDLVISLQVSVLLMIISILSYVTIYLLYQNRKQSLNRPIYLIAETSGDIEVE
ncbi:glycosyltransferase family 2 protein [Candidatus Izemoplasma sp. B36]|uniref:glycosyltransferase family 2 protein n=1 Tax=Candidatus Izemoplasma sp. B36 TaxID=3242468 RepID=UPI003556D338